VATFLTIVKFEVYSFNGSRQRHTVYDGMLPLSKMYDTGRYPQWASPNATLVTFWGYRFMHAHSRTCNPASLTRSLPALFPYLSPLRFHPTRPLSQATIEIGNEKWNSTGQSKQCELSSLANSVADGNTDCLQILSTNHCNMFQMICSLFAKNVWWTNAVL